MAGSLLGGRLRRHNYHIRTYNPRLYSLLGGTCHAVTMHALTPLIGVGWGTVGEFAMVCAAAFAAAVTRTVAPAVLVMELTAQETPPVYPQQIPPEGIYPFGGLAPDASVLPLELRHGVSLILLCVCVCVCVCVCSCVCVCVCVCVFVCVLPSLSLSL